MSNLSSVSRNLSNFFNGKCEERFLKMSNKQQLTVLKECALNQAITTVAVGAFVGIAVGSAGVGILAGLAVGYLASRYTFVARTVDYKLTKNPVEVATGMFQKAQASANDSLATMQSFADRVIPDAWVSWMV